MYETSFTFFSLINYKKMNFGNLLFSQPDDIKKSLRNIESIEKKLANTRIATVFNRTCLNEYIYNVLVIDRDRSIFCKILGHH